MKVLFTGASSFTGYWFIKTLAAAGHEMICPLRGSLDRYEGVRKARVENLQSICRLVPETPFGSDPFGKLVQENGSWDLLCHHATETADYKNPDFDVLGAVKSNTLNLRDVLGRLKSAGLKAVFLTGTVFENNEGAGDESLAAFSGYGLSKGLTWQLFRYYCGVAEIPLGKFVIPNPFGPFEEPRFTAHLMKNWRAGKVAEVKTPDYLRDNIHVDLLAASYGRFVSDATGSKSRCAKLNPSGYIESQGEFAQRAAREVRARTGWTCGLNLVKQQEFSEPLKRTNLDPAVRQFPNWNESAAWDAFVEFYSR
ncbi:MAG TPA: NAD(P)-dependent oxidoreductase [Verrucomicrobiae bacterium]|jgi:nucleoside-diphosphate-sugar epimerase|nr:NAD(P)-dependent oxidoreductase [Verrucomicrobiae bacterium]